MSGRDVNIDYLDEIGGLLGFESHIQDIETKSGDEEVCIWSEFGVFRTDYSILSPLNNGKPGELSEELELKEFIVIPDSFGFTNDEEGFYLIEESEINNIENVVEEFNPTKEAIKSLLIPSEEVRLLPSDSDYKDVVSGNTDLSYSKKLQMIQDVVVNSPVYRGELCNIWDIQSFEDIKNYLNEIQPYFDQDEKFRIVPSSKAIELSKTIFRIFLYGNTEVDFFGESSELSRENKYELSSLLSDLGLVKEGLEMEEIGTKSGKDTLVNKFHDSINVIRLGSSLISSLDDSYGEYSLKEISNEKIRYEKGSSYVEFKIAGKIVEHNDKKIFEDANLELLDYYIQRAEKMEQWENSMKNIDFNERKYKIFQNYKISKDSEKLKKYVSGWIDSSCVFRINVSEGNITTINPSIELDFSSEEQANIITKLSNILDFSFIVRNKIKIQRNESVMKFLEWVSDEVIRMKDVVDEILKLDMKDGKIGFSSYEKSREKVEDIVSAGYIDASGDKVVRTSGIDSIYTDEASGFGRISEHNIDNYYLAGLVDNISYFTNSAQARRDYSLGFSVRPILFIGSGRISLTDLKKVREILCELGINTSSQNTVDSERRIAIRSNSIDDFIELIDDKTVAMSTQIKKFRKDILPYHNGEKDRYKTPEEFVRYIIKCENMCEERLKLKKKNSSFFMQEFDVNDVSVSVATAIQEKYN